MGVLIIFVLIVAFILWMAASSQGSEKSSTRRQKPSRQSSNQADGDAFSVEVRTRSRTHFTVEDAYKESRNAWISPGKSVEIAGHNIPGGMVYVGDKLRTPGRYGTTDDPALINPRLRARAQRPDRSGKHLDYWPSYKEIPRSSRAAYLEWLAAGRRQPDVAIGYVFLFFYGLERRILLDMRHSDKAKGNLTQVLDEIEALRRVYAEQNNSFDGYSQRLLDFARLKYEEMPGSDSSPPSVCEGRTMPLVNKVSLGTLVSKGAPLPPEWALAWLRGNPHHRLNTPGRRCKDAFGQLFKEWYEDRFPEGLTVKASNPSLNATYRPASSAFRQTQSIAVDGAVDIDKCPFPEELSRLADDVEAALDAYSRWIGRRGDRSSPAAIGQLPPSLIPDRAGEEGRELISEIENELGEEDHAVLLSDWIVGKWPSKNDGRLTKTEADGLSGFLAGFGLGIEPDVRYTRNPSKRDYVTIFRLEGDDNPPGEQFKDARLLLHLAAAVAGADEAITAEEERHIEKHLEEGLELTPAERRRLRAHLERRLAHPPTLRGVRRKAEKLEAEERHRLGTFLLTVAGADGHLRREELNIIEKIYEILGLKPDQVHQDLHAMSTRSSKSGNAPLDSGPVTVIEADAEPERYTIADKDEASEADKVPGSVTLDLDRVKNVQAETRDVAKVLSDVFEDEDDDEDEYFAIEGLSPEQEALIAELRAQHTWSREAFDRVAEKHGLMPGFAIEQINEIVFDLAGEPLLEGEDPIEINTYALEALQS